MWKIIGQRKLRGWTWGRYTGKTECRWFRREEWQEKWKPLTFRTKKAAEKEIGKLCDRSDERKLVKAAKF